jgi:4-diphosphocytidyl-2-C-methyl-D-erythritol kinase
MIIEKSSDGFRIKVPCKINLYLEVLGKRSDGYHSLDTVMMAVSLFDELSIGHRDDDRLRLEMEFADGSGQALDDEDPAWNIPADQTNLCIRALDKLRHAIGQPALGANLKLIKRIPAMAGLGGGSADAAAALVLGILLWTTRMDVSLAMSMARDLGSDINFFLESHHQGHWLARCQGRGEFVEALQAKGPFTFVIAHPPIGCATRDVFAAWNGGNAPSDRDPQTLIRALNEGDTMSVGRELWNGLEVAAEKTTPWIERSRKWIDRYDHHGQVLSGSGSARFCLCESLEQAEKMAIEINLQGEMRAFCVQSWRAPGIEAQIRKIRYGS